LWPISEVANRPSAVVQVSGKRTSNYFTRLVLLKRVLLQYLDFFGSRHEARENSGVLTRTLIALLHRDESTPTHHVNERAPGTEDGSALRQVELTVASP